MNSGILERGEKSLRRERHGEDLVWKWESFPGFGWSLAWEEAT